MFPHSTCDICSPHQSWQTPFISFLPFLDSLPQPPDIHRGHLPNQRPPCKPWPQGLFLGSEGRNGPSRSKTVPQAVGILEPAKGPRWEFGLRSRVGALHCTPRTVAVTVVVTE